MKRHHSERRGLETFKFVFATMVLAAGSTAAAYDYTLPAGALADSLPDDAAFDTCLRSAIESEGACVLPSGTLTLTTYPPALRQEIPQGILDLRNATLRGQGPSTLIKGVGPSGFDVISLNGAANFNIRDLSITTEAAVDGHGINGISMTNGTHNVRIRNVHVYSLPYLQKAGYVDGGKAFTIQTGEYNTGVSMKNIYVEYSSSRNVWTGFHMDADTNKNVEPDNINVIGNSFEGDFSGITFAFMTPTQPMQTFGAAVLDNAAKGGKYGIALGRGRAYYLRGNHVVLRDDLYKPNYVAGDFIDSRQTLLLSEVPYITAELNTFESRGGGYFLRAVGANSSTTMLRQNHFYGQPSARTNLTRCSPDFASYFDAAGVFY